MALTDRWSILAGLRHDRAIVQRTDLISGQRTFSKTYSNTGWRTGTVFALRPTSTLYAQFSQASDPISGLLMISPNNGAFDLSRGKQVEVGFKQGFDGGEWTLAAYRIRKTGLLSRDPLNPDRRVQVGAQTSKGVEASLAWVFAPAWSLDLNATVLKAEFEDFLETTGSPVIAVSRDGNVPPNVAERLANAWVSWQVATDWTVATGVRYVGKRYADTANTLQLPGYATTDVTVSWQARPATRLTARVFNAFDKTFYETAYYTDTQWLRVPTGASSSPWTIVSDGQSHLDLPAHCWSFHASLQGHTVRSLPPGVRACGCSRFARTARRAFAQPGRSVSTRSCITPNFRAGIQQLDIGHAPGACETRQLYRFRIQCCHAHRYPSVTSTSIGPDTKVSPRFTP